MRQSACAAACQPHSYFAMSATDESRLAPVARVQLFKMALAGRIDRMFDQTVGSLLGGLGSERHIDAVWPIDQNLAVLGANITRLRK